MGASLAAAQAGRPGAGMEERNEGSLIMGGRSGAMVYKGGPHDWESYYQIGEPVWDAGGRIGVNWVIGGFFESKERGFLLVKSSDFRLGSELQSSRGFRMQVMIRTASRVSEFCGSLCSREGKTREQEGGDLQAGIGENSAGEDKGTEGVITEEELDSDDRNGGRRKGKAKSEAKSQAEIEEIFVRAEGKAEEGVRAEPEQRDESWIGGGQGRAAVADRVAVALLLIRVVDYFRSQALEGREEVMRTKLRSRMEIGEGSGSSGALEMADAPEPTALAIPRSGSGGQGRESVKLVTSWCSPFAHRVAMSLAVKGVEYVAIEESSLNKNTRTLNANPADKRIPILMHKGRAISDSLIIMEYIDEVWPESLAALLPKDPFERSAARYWGDFIEIKIAQMLLRHIGVNVKEVYESVNDALIGLNRAMAVISFGKPFFMGDELGFVDIVFAPMIPWILALRRLDNFKIPNGQECPRLHEWLRALQNHPSVRPSLEMSPPKKLREFIVTNFRKT